VVRVLLDLPADPLDVHVQRFGVAEVVGSPNEVDKEVPGEEPVLAAQEGLQEVELLGGDDTA